MARFNGSPRGWYDVRDYGAKGDGSSDDTAAFQLAVAVCSAAGGGRVYAPPGNYYFAGHIGNIPANVSLYGANSLSNSHSNTYDSPWQAGHDLSPTAGGTTFLLTETTGGATGTPFITQTGSNGTIGNICFHYPNQLTSASTPTAYPWCIKQSACSDVSVIGCEFLKAYQGIWSEWGFRNTIRDVRGNVLSQGIRCEGGADVTRLENIHFGPWQTFGTTVDTWVKANLTAFNLGRNDLINWRSCFVYGANVGINLYLDTAHNLNIGYTSACWGDFDGGGLDVCNTCVQIAAIQPEPCTFRGLHLTTVGGRCLDVLSGYAGVAEFANCFWYSSTGQQIRVRGAGRVNVIGGYFASSLNSNSLAPASPAGSACDLGGTGVAKVIGADFADTQTHVTLASGLTKATVVGNTCSPGGTFTVSNSMAGGTYAVANNI